MDAQVDDRQSEYEREYRSDMSSAGQSTRRLAAPQIGGAFSNAVLTSPNRRNNVAALALIAVGVLLLLGRLGFGELNVVPGVILAMISSGFLFFAFWRHIFGLSIPGFILAGLSLGVTFVDVTGGVSVLWGLALGFFLIFALGRALFRVNSAWAMIPSVILFGIGCIVAMTQLPSFLAGGFFALPLLLVGAGLYLGWGRRTA